MTEHEQAHEELEYNGWSNYPTWAVVNWLSSEQATAQTIEAVLDTVGTQPEAAHGRAWVEDGNPLADKASLYSDLLTWALGQVGWAEVAGCLRPDEWRKEPARIATTANAPVAIDSDIEPYVAFSAERHAETLRRTLERLTAGDLHCPDCTAPLFGQTLYIGGIAEVRLVCPKEECGFESM